MRSAGFISYAIQNILASEENKKRSGWMDVVGSFCVMWEQSHIVFVYWNKKGELYTNYMLYYYTIWHCGWIMHLKNFKILKFFIFYFNMFWNEKNFKKQPSIYS
jgi:hypothetical protein